MKQGTLKRILKYTGAYRLLLFVSILCALGSVVLTLSIPVLTGWAVDVIIGPRQVDFQALLPIIRDILILVAVTAVLQWLMQLAANRMTYAVIRDIRHDAFAQLQRLPLKFLDTHAAGGTVSRIITDTDQLAEGLLMGFTQLFTGVATIIGTLGFMFSVNLRITLVVLVLTPLSLFAASFIAKRTYALFHAQADARSAQTAFIDEMISNQKVVRAFGRERRAMEQFGRLNSVLERRSLRAVFYSSLTNPTTRFINGLVYAAVGVFGALSAIRGGMTVGQLSCFLSYATQYTKPFNEISGVVTELQNAFACAARVFELIDTPPQPPDRSGAAVLRHADGRVELSHVYFSYTPDQKLIQDFNLQVQSGQRIAIVGPTGCGKTTLINLLMRFYDPDGGRIAVDGTDVRDITRKSLRAQYGMVLQETWLRGGTIRENIALGRPEATDEEILAAAKASHAHSFIRRLPHGYDTIISEDGGALSQGQKQLLCIARVMLCLPPMLILDEATSSIDTRTEVKIQQAFRQMMQGRTSFIVAHRLSTIREADVILVMRGGNVVEQGTHDELLARGGFYAQLYNSQFDRETD